MALLEPKLAVLDETNSGLDIDALKVVSDGVNRLRSPERSFVVITHYQRLLDYIVPDVVHVLSKRPHRAHRRQGTGARARSQGLCAIPGRDGVMNADVRPIKTAAETALSAAFATAKGSCRARRRLRETAFKRFETAGLPHRRVEEWKYTDLRALMRDAKPLAAPPDAAAKARAKNAGAAFAAVEGRRIVLVDGAFVPELSDLAGLEAGPHHPLDGAGAGGRRRGGDGAAGQVVPTDDVAVALNTAFMGDGVVIEVAPSARADAAAASRVLQCRRRAGLGVHPLARRDRQGRAGDADREPRGRGGQRLPGQHRARDRGRRRGPCRSRQDHRRGRRRAACVEPDGRGRRARALQRIPVHHRRCGGAQPAVRPFQGRGDGRQHPRRDAA